MILDIFDLGGKVAVVRFRKAALPEKLREVRAKKRAVDEEHPNDGGKRREEPAALRGNL